MHKYLNVNSIEKQIVHFGRHEPFDHVVIDNFFNDDFVKYCSDEFPDFNSNVWHEYANSLEIKKACNNWNIFPEKTYQAFAFLNSEQFVSYLSEKIFDGKKLYSDAGLNGGGWHIHKQGGKLNTHLDYSLHPKLKLQRKFNIIVYMNPNWNVSWGGALGFWDNYSAEKPGDCVKKVECLFNRAVIFDTSQNSWHGLPEPVNCPENEARKSIAVYYLCDPPAEVDNRGKALFAPTKDQENDTRVLDLIRERASTKTAAFSYKSRSD